MSKFEIGAFAKSIVQAAPAVPRDIGAITGEILEAKRAGGEAILTIGRCLMEAKELLPHGEWLPWLSEQAELSERTAQKFMRLAREWSNPSALADLGATKALMLLALPAEEREQFVADRHVVDMTSRQLEAAIKERDEARMAAQTALADAAAAQAARDKMAEDMAVVNACLASAREEQEQAGRRAMQLEAELSDLRSRPVEVAVKTVADQEAVDRARDEARAEMHSKLAKAKEAAARAREKQQQAEAKAEELERSLAEREKADKQAALSTDRELAQFEVLFNQGQELANKLHGLLLKARGREDQATAQGMEQALRALAEAIGRCAG